jgi:superoxide dismutase, Fe-Mn family
MFELPPLPYAYDALQPVISDRTMRHHHDKHQATYVEKTNKLLADAKKQPESLEDLIREAKAEGDKKLFNNAAQIWNHTFFWTCMSPKKLAPEGELKDAIAEAFGDQAKLKKAFVEAGADHFGSGWVWLIADRGNKLEVRSTHDADDTVPEPGLTPLLVCDLWEHAYYLDHQQDRKGYLEAWFDALPNWKFAGDQFHAMHTRGELWRHPAPTAEHAHA